MTRFNSYQNRILGRLYGQVGGFKSMNAARKDFDARRKRDETFEQIVDAMLDRAIDAKWRT